MRILIISLVILFSGCGVKRIILPPEVPSPNMAPGAKPKITFDHVDLNDDGSISEGEVQKYNAINSIPDKKIDSWSPLKWFTLIMSLIFIGCCGPWAGKKIKEKVDKWKSD